MLNLLGSSRDIYFEIINYLFSFFPIRNLVSSWGCISSSVSLLKIQAKTGLSAGISGQEERTASGSVLFPATYPTPLGCTFLLSRCNPPPPTNWNVLTHQVFIHLTGCNRRTVWAGFSPKHQMIARFWWQVL
jgi:hypothetical protein